MAYEPYPTGAELPNLVNVTKRMDPNGSIAKIAELLTRMDPVLGDIPMIEGNLPTGHRTTVRTGIPSPTWRKLNYGVYPTKSTTAQVDDTIGMMEAYSEIDKDLAMLNGNTSEYRMSEDTPHLEGMSNAMADTIWYGDTSTNPERFLGLAPRYASLGTPANKPTAQDNSAYLKHVISAGGATASVQTSIWLIAWGENTVHGIYPKGSQAGLLHEDLGEQTLKDNAGGRYQGYRTHYQWKKGLCVRDWRYIVRIANVELAKMDTEANQKLLLSAMIRARYTMPAGARPIYYASPATLAMLDISQVFKSNGAFQWKDIQGQDVATFRGSLIKPSHGILETEAVLT